MAKRFSVSSGSCALMAGMMLLFVEHIGAQPVSAPTSGDKLCSVDTTAANQIDTVISAPDSEGFVSIFDGKSFKGWWQNCLSTHSAADRTNGAIWRVDTARKAIYSMSREGVGGLLSTHKRYAHYELMFETWLEYGDDGGVFNRYVITSATNVAANQMLLDYLGTSGMLSYYSEANFPGARNGRPWSYNTDSTITIPGSGGSAGTGGTPDISDWLKQTSRTNLITGYGPTDIGCALTGCTQADYLRLWNRHGWMQIRQVYYGGLSTSQPATVTSQGDKLHEFTFFRKHYPLNDTNLTRTQGVNDTAKWIPVVQDSMVFTASQAATYQKPAPFAFQVHTGARFVYASAGGKGAWYRDIKVRELDSLGRPVLLNLSNLTYSANPAVYPVGTAIANNTPTVSGLVTSYSVTPSLPAGLSLNTSTGVISGTPTLAAATNNYTITATNSAGSTTANLTLTVAVGQWTKQTSGTPYALINTHFVNSNTGWAVGVGIFKTTDGGNTWSAQTSGTTDILFSVQFVDVNTGWAVGGSSTLKTTNSGITWSPQTSSTSALYGVHFANANTGWTVGASGTIRKTTNGGTNWSTLTNFTTSTLDAIYSVDTNTAWVVGASGIIRKTTNGGTLWSAQTSGTTNSLWSVYFLDANTGWSAGSGGTILKTTNGGTTWSSQNSNTGKFLYTVHFVDGNNGWVVGDSGFICNTTNGGETWSTQVSGTTNGLRGVYFVDASNGWAVGGSGTILKSPSSIMPLNLSYSPKPAVYSTNVGPDTLTATLSQATSPITYSLFSGSLPPGFSLNTSTGRITGTPTTAGGYGAIIQAANTSGNDTETVNITVLQSPSGLNYTQNSPSYGKGIAITPDTASLASGIASKFKITSGALPTGLSIDTTTGRITGTPTAAGTFTPTITASNAGGGSTTRQLTITVIAPPTSLTYSSQPATYGVNVAISNNSPTIGGTTSISRYSISPTLPDSLFFDTTTGIISGKPKNAQVKTNYVVTATNVAGSITDTLGITVLAAPSALSYSTPVIYGVNVAVAPNAPAVTGTVTHYVISPALSAGLSMDTNTGIISGTPTAAKVSTSYSIIASNVAGFTTANLSITVLSKPTGLTYSKPSPVYGVNIVAVNDSPTVTGTVSRYSISPSLPDSLFFDTVTGVISGKPKAAQASTAYLVTAANVAGSDTETVRITVFAAPTNLTYSTNPATYGVNVTIANNTPSASATTTHYSVSPALPSGLSLDTNTGIISGAVSNAQVQTAYLITGSNIAGSDTETLRITVLAKPVSLTYSMGTAVFGVNIPIISDTPIVTGTIAKYSIAPALPAGLLFDTATGIVSGTPSVASNLTPYLITATNVAGSDTETVRFTVLAKPVNLTYSQNPATYGVNAAIANNNPSVTGTVTRYTISPAAPAGLAFDTTTGILSGTPTSAQTQTPYIVTSTNVAGSDTETVRITVLASPASLSYRSPVVYGVNVPAAADSPNVTGMVMHYTISPALSAGLSLDTNTGVISGTPMIAKAATAYSIIASNVAGFTTTNLSITVLAAPTGLTYSRNPATYGAGIPIAPDTTLVTGTVTKYFISPALPTGLLFDTTTGRITGTPVNPQVQANYFVTASNIAGSDTETLHITVLAAPTNLSYITPLIFGVNVAITPDTPIVTGTITTYSVSPNLPAGLALDTNTGIITGTPTNAQAATNYTLVARNIAGFTITQISITVLAAPTNLSYTSPVVYGVAIPITSSNPTVTGVVSRYSVTPVLPGGIKLDSVTGAFSGTATGARAAGNYTVTATNVAGSTNAVVNIRVVVAPTNLSYVDDPTTYVLGIPITPNNPSVTGFVFRYSSAPSLPPGLILDSTTGVIAGTPTGTQSFAANYTITARNIAGQTQTTITTGVVGPPSNLSYADDAPTYGINAAILPPNTPVVHGIVTLYTITPNLPTGIMLDQTTGYIMGTPTVLSASTDYTISAFNPGGTATTSINLGVVTPP